MDDIPSIVAILENEASKRRKLEREQNHKTTENNDTTSTAPTVENTDITPTNSAPEKWYKNSTIIIILGIIVAPVGLFLLWKYEADLFRKVVLTLIFIWSFFSFYNVFMA